MTNKAEIEFISKDQVTKTITKIEKKLGSLSKKLQKNNKKTETSFIKMSNVVETALGVSIAGVISRTANEVKEFFKSSIKGALEFENELRALEIQTRGTAKAFITDLKVATKGLVSDLNLAKSANRALALGIEKARLPELFEAAAARGKVLGVDVTQALDDISLGIGRGSKLILDNLGIIFDLGAEYDNYAKTLNKTSAELTEFEKKQALTNAVINSTTVLLSRLQGAQQTTQDRIEELSASFENFKITIGSGLKTALEYAINGFSLLDEAIVAAQVEIDAFNEKNEQSISILERINQAEQNLAESRKGFLEGNVQKTKEELDIERQIAIKRAEIAKTQQQLSADIGKGISKDELVKANESILMQQKAVDKLSTKLSQFKEIAKGAFTAAQISAEEEGALPEQQLPGIENLETFYAKQIDTIKKKQEELNTTVINGAKELNELIIGNGEELTRTNDKINNLALAYAEVKKVVEEIKGLQVDINEEIDKQLEKQKASLAQTLFPDFAMINTLR